MQLNVPEAEIHETFDNVSRRVAMFGLEICNTTMHEAVCWLTRRALGRRKTLLNFVNAHCVNVAAKDAAYRSVLVQSDRLLPDGSGVKLAMRMRGLRLVENLNGTDLFPHLCRAAARHDLSLFLLGARPGVAQKVAANMTRRHPGLRIVGTQDGFFEANSEPAVVDAINRSGADILLVAMGVPRQELWLARNLGRLRTSVNLGVGGLFDFYSDRVSRAPLWLRRRGLEWVWRLGQEPGRMWCRYVLGNPAFVLRAMRDAVQSRRRPRGADVLERGSSRAFRRRLHWWIQSRATPLGKRTLDVCVAGLVGLALAPLIAATALAIRIESPGPIFFAQERVGLRGKTFRLWKFRSMYVDAESRRDALNKRNEMSGGVLFKMKSDPRITRVGRIIRRLSIDELPQLWNVLRGEMALVGPRPALPSEVAQYSLAQRGRLSARPGITCIWQVSGRSDIPFERQVEMDLEYIHAATVKNDLRLLLKTVPAVVSGRGAY